MRPSRPGLAGHLRMRVVDALHLGKRTTGGLDLMKRTRGWPALNDAEGVAPCLATRPLA